MTRINLGTGDGRRADWRTPRWLFDLLDKEFHFTLDAAATPENALCPMFFTEEQNGLEKSWTMFAAGMGKLGSGAVFCNPPYGQKQLPKWMSKAFLESCPTSTTGVTCVLLVPARTDAYWFHDLAMLGEVRFIRSRVNFDGGGRKAPFPSCVVIFRKGSDARHGSMSSIISPDRRKRADQVRAL